MEAKSPLPRSVSDSKMNRWSSPKGVSPTHSQEMSSFQVELENMDLKKKLAQKEEDCRMAAMVGQSLLSEIERVRSCDV
jgi:hypothetical protein